MSSYHAASFHGASLTVSRTKLPHHQNAATSSFKTRSRSVRLGTVGSFGTDGVITRCVFGKSAADGTRHRLSLLELYLDTMQLYRDANLTSPLSVRGRNKNRDDRIPTTFPFKCLFRRCARVVFFDFLSGFFSVVFDGIDSLMEAETCFLVAVDL